MIDTVDEPSKPSFKLLWIFIGGIVVLILGVTVFRPPSPATRIIMLNDVVKGIKDSDADIKVVEDQMIADADRISPAGIKTQKQLAEKAYRTALATATKWVRQNQTFKSKKADYLQSSPREWQKLESNLDDLCGELFTNGLSEVARRSSTKRLPDNRKAKKSDDQVSRLPNTVRQPVIKNVESTRVQINRTAAKPRVNPSKNSSSFSDR